MRASGTIEGMTRTTVTIDDEKLDALRTLAAERGVSVSCLVREAVDEKLSKQPLPGPRPKPRALGMGDSGYSDTSELASDFGEIVEAGLEVVSARRRFSALGLGSSKEVPTARELGDVDPEYPPFR